MHSRMVFMVQLGGKRNWCTADTMCNTNSALFRCYCRRCLPQKAKMSHHIWWRITCSVCVKYISGVEFTLEYAVLGSKSSLSKVPFWTFSHTIRYQCSEPRQTSWSSPLVSHPRETFTHHTRMSCHGIQSICGKQICARENWSLPPESRRGYMLLYCYVADG